ncbi:O-antigen polysaccharide polymerase Wzy family protein [Enterococcus gallinarum]|uniref:O-antigen polysaccharide polymerase Wzy family protein n=1 Tax=Enterococcus gallinarum TaxID=1353 RepID=UPI003137E2F6
MYILTSSLIFLLAMYFNSVFLSLLSCVMLLLSNLQYCLIDFKKNILFFCFNITFFIFLIGRMVITEFFSYNEHLRGIAGLDFVSFDLVSNTLTCIFVSLLSLFLGYILFNKISFMNKRNQLNKNNESLKLSSLLLFFVAVIIRLYIVIEMRKASVTEGYFETFTTFHSSLPSIIQTFGNMYDVFLFSFLATFPKKKEVILPSFLYVLEGAIAASSGRRSVLILNILILAVYFLSREDNESETEVWFGMKEKFFSIVSVPILIILMTFIGRIRSNFNSINSIKASQNSFFEFFYSQGISANLIGYTDIYRNDLPKGRLWTFGPFMEFIENSIVRPLQGLPPLSGQSLARAQNGFLFSQALPYLIMPTAYLQGYGYGSSFVAENYADLGLFGVFLGSLVYGGILLFLSKSLKRGNFVLIVISLSMARSILFAPRAAYFSFIVSTFSPSKIVAIILVYVFSIVFVKKHL